MIVEVLVPEREREHALGDQIRRRVLHRPLLAEVGDTLAQPRHQVAQAAVRFAQQQSPAVQRHPPTIEIRDHVALAVRLELQLLRRAPCFHEPSLRNQCKILITKILYTV